MPGPVSESHETPICRCQHFGELHPGGGPCEAEGCPCRRFDRIPFEDSDLGRAMDEMIDGEE